LTPLSASQGGNAFVLTVNGLGFANGAVVRWNGDALTTTFGADTNLTAEVSAANLTAAGAAQITVLNPNNSASDAWAFFITENTAAIVAADAVTSVDPGGTVVAAAGAGATGVTATAQGAGTLAVAQYDANPGGAATFVATDAYLDVNLSPDNAFTQVEIAFCGLNGGTQVYWWTGAAWQLASHQVYDPDTGCATITVNATTSPNLAQLAGTYFAGAAAPTSVSLIAFTAAATKTIVALAWETAAELDTLGFHLYRATSPAGPFTRLTAELIPARGDALTGASYAYADAPGAGAFSYELEAVLVGGGVTRHGPVGVQVGLPQRLYLPLMTR